MSFLHKKDGDSEAEVLKKLAEINLILQKVESTLPQYVIQSEFQSKVEKVAANLDHMRNDVQHLEEGQRQVANIISQKVDDWTTARYQEQEKKLASLESQLAEQTAAVQKAAVDCAAVEQRSLDIIQAVIAYRDQVFLQWEYARDQNAETAQMLLQGVLDGLRTILVSNGVEVLDSNGTFNQKIQRVVESRHVDSPEQHLQIAYTLQAGYRIQDKLIRPQEVCVYQYTGAENA